MSVRAGGGLKRNARIEVVVAILREAVETRSLRCAGQLEVDVRVGDCGRVRDFLEPFYLFLVRAMVREFVADDGAGVRNESSDDVLLQPQGKVEIRPGFVPIF